MLRRPLSMVCLMIILIIYLGTGFVGRLPSAGKEREGEEVTVTGRVYQKECTVKAGKERKILYLHLADTGSKVEKTNIICYLKADQELPEMGSTVRVKGKRRNFEEPSDPGQFDAESYYHILKISFQLNQTEIQAKSDNYSKMGEALYKLREHFSFVLENNLSKTDASVMKAMLLGEKGAADHEIKALYQRNGIAHILAISGVYTLSLVYITLCKTPIFCPFWAF